MVHGPQSTVHSPRSTVHGRDRGSSLKSQAGDGSITTTRTSRRIAGTRRRGRRRSRWRLPGGSGSAFHRFIAYRPPAKNQVPFLSASGSMTGRRKMNMDMSCAIVRGVLQLPGTLQSLVQITGLSYVERNPTAVLRLFGVYVGGWQWAERSAQGMDLVLILVAGLAGPLERRSRALRLLAATQ